MSQSSNFVNDFEQITQVSVCQISQEDQQPCFADYGSLRVCLKHRVNFSQDLDLNPEPLDLAVQHANH